ncbi:MAG: Kae1-associated kinase Bud32 [Candidatus Bathyarchaeota archaeon]|nr:Kae1-associated kinase Bud32 [Candidatus Bathyarchaeota archaeon]
MKTFLMKKGAEASLYLSDWHGRKVVLKKRLAKKYRPKILDEQIRIYRTIHEPQLMHEAKRAGVPTPTIFLVDIKNATIIMEFIEGKQVKQLLSETSKGERESLCLKIGKLIGRLHENGIIHGDLTTSNMILTREGKIFFVDFGLGEKSKELEARGVDLHLMKRALQSTHFRFAEECFNAIIRGYAKVMGSETAKNILEKIREIEQRGRYVAERKGEL